MGLFRSAIIFVLTIWVSSVSFAGDFKWSGGYRFEGLSINNLEADANGQTKSYMLHHLILKPEIVAYDGLVIRSRFDLLNNSSHPNSQLGQTFGSSVSQGDSSTTQSQDTSAVLSKNQATDTLGVTEVYATWSHEFGALTVGRAPIHFGLGIMFNAGYGAFDHWLNNRDMVAYRLVTGNFSVMPVLAKVKEGLLGSRDDVNDFILNAEYENPETELKIGLIYQARRSGSGADSNDSPTSVLSPGGAQFGNYEVDTYNFFVSQWVNRIKVGFEVGFADGGTGLSTANGIEVNHKGVGGALKLEYLPENSPWSGILDMGYASGDDPSTENIFEGYIFDRNFDVAFLMFNHVAGRYDMLGSSYANQITRTPTAGNPATSARPNASNSYDVEAISNALYASVGLQYKWAEKYSFRSKFTYGNLSTDPLNTDVDTDLGFEVDLAIGYEPIEGFQWITQLGILSPGGAFEGGSANGFGTDMIYGLETKAAISF